MGSGGHRIQVLWHSTNPKWHPSVQMDGAETHSADVAAQRTTSGGRVQPARACCTICRTGNRDSIPPLSAAPRDCIAEEAQARGACALESAVRCREVVPTADCWLL
jgi:hypothetical protein